MGAASDSESAGRRDALLERRWLPTGDACEACEAGEAYAEEGEGKEDESLATEPWDEGLGSGESSVLGDARNLRMWLGMENVDSDADAASGFGTLAAEVARSRD